MTTREDLETAVLLLVGKACERALAKEKNRRKTEVQPLRLCIAAIGEEWREVQDAYYNREGDDAVIDELGDVIATAGLALWRAHGGNNDRL